MKWKTPSDCKTMFDCGDISCDVAEHEVWLGEVRQYPGDAHVLLAAHEADQGAVAAAANHRSVLGRPADQ